MLRSSNRALVSLGFVAALVLSGPIALYGLGCIGGTNDDYRGVCTPDDPSSCPCTMDDKCPTDTECTDWSCINGYCKSQPKTGSSVKSQEPGDCQTNVCASDGGTTFQPDPTDTPPASDDCHIGVCKGTEKAQDFRPLGHSCTQASGKPGVCDGVGSCNCEEGTSNGCDTGGICYKADDGQFKCAPCDNGQPDGDETGTDCGGTCADKKLGKTPTCALGQTCSKPSDCTSGNCVDGVCCEDVCAGQCKSCNQDGKLGLCRYVPTGTPDSLCDPGNVCVAAPMMGTICLGSPMTTCTAASQCMSGVCTQNKCEKGTKGAPCGSKDDCQSGTCTNYICG